MTPTTLYMGWTQVAFTPTGGLATTINRVQSIEYDPGGQLTPYAGDNNRLPVGMFLFMSQPRMTVHSDNLGVTAGLSPGGVGTLVAVLNDATNKDVVGSGALKFTLNNAAIENNPGGGQYGQFAHSSVTFRAYSTDGQTSPLASVAL